MATLTVRNLPEPTGCALKERAALNDRSMEAEARAILLQATDPDTDCVADWLDASQHLRGEPLVLPERSRGREVDLA